MQHEWHAATFTGTVTCSKCGLLPMDEDDTESECPGSMRITDKESHRRLNPLDYILEYGYSDYILSEGE